jgi:4-hydroxy-L-threonine phosphate dehydrogenase PdxA
VLALKRPDVRAACEPVLVGERAVWQRAGWTPSLAGLVDTRVGGALPPSGKPTALSGKLSFAALGRSLELIRRGLGKGLVTAPISKKAWDLAGVPYRDHTQWLSEETGRNGQMVLAAPGQDLWTVIATRHIPLAQVSPRLSPAGVLAAARSLHEALRSRGLKRPRLGLCGLNPHAGEDGLLGPEERRVLVPAAARARAARLDLSGPIAADTAWRWHAQGKLDGLVCLYHDQSLIALKALAGLAIVNWTTGLPFPRTSPGHGTAFDLGRRDPDPTATAQAALLCAELAGRA